MEIGIFFWSTDYYHPDNGFTLVDWLADNLEENCATVLLDGSYGEIENSLGERFSLMASGNGDSFNHKIEIRKL